MLRTKTKRKRPIVFSSLLFKSNARRYHVDDCIRILQPHSLCALLLSSRGTGVDELSVRVDDPLDESFRFEVGDGASGEGSVNLHSVDEGRGGDDSVSWDLLHDSLAAG